jgi:hypothetical protein
MKTFGSADNLNYYKKELNVHGDVSFRVENNIYKGFGNKDFYLNSDAFYNYTGVEFIRYFYSDIPSIIEIDE